jgi:hypothetical protein
LNGELVHRNDVNAVQIDRTRLTVREFVHTSVLGGMVRIRLSNEYGQEPLVVQDARLALRDTSTANSVLAATDNALTSSGSASVTIPVGAIAIGDSVEMKVPALKDVGLSFYLPASDDRRRTDHRPEAVNRPRP